MPKPPAIRAELADLLDVKRTLANSMKRKRITVAGLAKQLGTGRTAVRRALDAKNTSTTFKTIQRTARALGYTVKLEARPLTPSELGNLAQKMVDAKTPEEGDRLQKELVNGFFGHAEGSAQERSTGCDRGDSEKRWNERLTPMNPTCRAIFQSVISSDAT